MINGHASTYKDPAQARYEAQMAAMLMQHRPDMPIEGPVSVEIMAYLPVAKSYSKKKTADMLAGRIRPVAKPDVDNLAKNILDLLTGVYIVNDRQCVGLYIEKWYSTNPRWIIQIRKVEHEPYAC